MQHSLPSDTVDDIQNWTAEDVADAIDNVAVTLKKLPPVKVQGYFNVWPQIVLSDKEIASAMPSPSAFRLTASAHDISMIDVVSTWMLWLDVNDRHLLWMRAFKKPWKEVCMHLGMCRSTLQRQRTKALTKISQRLNDHKILS